MSKKRISATIPNEYKDEIDSYVKEGRYSSRSEFVRIAISNLLDAEKDYQPPQKGLHTFTDSMQFGRRDEITERDKEIWHKLIGL